MKRAVIVLAICVVIGALWAGSYWLDHRYDGQDSRTPVRAADWQAYCVGTLSDGGGSYTSADVASCVRRAMSNGG